MMHEWTPAEFAAAFGFMVTIGGLVVAPLIVFFFAEKRRHNREMLAEKRQHIKAVIEMAEKEDTHG